MRRPFDLVDHSSGSPGCRASSHPWLKPEKTDMRWLPINQDIEMPDDTPMPLVVLRRIIERPRIG